MELLLFKAYTVHLRYTTRSITLDFVTRKAGRKISRSVCSGIIHVVQWIIAFIVFTIRARQKSSEIYLCAVLHCFHLLIKLCWRLPSKRHNVRIRKRREISPRLSCHCSRPRRGCRYDSNIRRFGSSSFPLIDSHLFCIQEEGLFAQRVIRVSHPNTASCTSTMIPSRFREGSVANGVDIRQNVNLIWGDISSKSIRKC